MSSADRRVLFVCSGNICRSPLAEYLARDLHAERILTFESAGTYASPGQHATDHAQAVGLTLGVDMSSHRSQSIESVDPPDLVFGMEQQHLITARDVFPNLPRGSIRLLDYPSEIADPYGRSIDAYRTAAASIQRSLQALEL